MELAQKVFKNQKQIGQTKRSILILPGSDQKLKLNSIEIITLQSPYQKNIFRYNIKTLKSGFGAI